MKKPITLDLMRPGNWNGFNITKDFIKQIATATKNRDYQNNEGPIVKGHPKHDSPAFGWWKKDNVKIANNGHLQVEMSEEDFDKEFLTELKNKKYGPISIALRPSDLSLKHIGFFGGTTTAVNGLTPAFSEQDFENNDVVLEFAECNLRHDPTGIGETIVEFAELNASRYQLNSTESVLRNIKNFFISKFDLKTANDVIPEHLLSNIKEPLQIWETPKNEFNEPPTKTNFQFNNQEDNMSPEKLKELQDKAAKAEQLEAANNKMKTELANAKQQLQFTEAEKRLQNALLFCESDDMKNKITPAIKTKVAHTLASLEATEEPIKFSENNKEVTVNATEVFKEILGMLPNFEFAEFAKNGESQTDDTLAKEAAESAKEINNEM